MRIWDKICGKQNGFAVTEPDIARYLDYLKGEERAAATVEKYGRDVRAFVSWAAVPSHDLRSATELKAVAIAYKQDIAKRYAASSVNSMLAALNNFFAFMGWGVKVRPLKIQRQTFARADKELSRAEYERLLAAAQREDNERLYLLMKTICATGIRVSELCCITVAAAQEGKAEVTNKGKTRTVFLPEKLQRELLKYARKHGLSTGAVFVTKSGRPLDRSAIWAAMKKLCATAGVAPSKVFPHNLRHLFARTFYALDKDIARLADLLGHSSIDTTRIYIMESGEEHRRCVNLLGLVT